jgi:hypothetical protein
MRLGLFRKVGGEERGCGREAAGESRSLDTLDDRSDFSTPLRAAR